MDATSVNAGGFTPAKDQFNFSYRAGKLKTKSAQQHLDQQPSVPSLAPGVYWSTYVKTKADVEQYYSLYHPSYPKPLVTAIAQSMEDALTAHNSGTASDDTAKFVRRLVTGDRILENGEVKPFVSESKWNPDDEIRKHFTEGQINVTMKRLDQLGQEEEEVQKVSITQAKKAKQSKR